MSEQLKAFYLAYAAWLDDGAPEQKPFSSWNGLCQNLFNFCICQTDDYTLSNRTKAEMIDQFTNAGLNDNYPFDCNSIKYEQAGQRYECHLNPKRIAWVRKQLKK